MAKNHSLVLNDGCLNFIEENDDVVVAGFGHKGQAVSDIPGVCFKIVKIGIPGWLGGLALPSAQGLILETWDRVPCQAPCVEPASPPACVSASLSLCLS